MCPTLPKMSLAYQSTSRYMIVLQDVCFVYIWPRYIKHTSLWSRACTGHSELQTQLPHKFFTLLFLLGWKFHPSIHHLLTHRRTRPQDCVCSHTQYHNIHYTHLGDPSTTWATKKSTSQSHQWCWKTINASSTPHLEPTTLDWGAIKRKSELHKWPNNLVPKHPSSGLSWYQWLTCLL